MGAHGKIRQKYKNQILELLISSHRLCFLVTSLKMLQSDWLMKCKDIVIMTLRGAKMIFLDT